MPRTPLLAALLALALPAFAQDALTTVSERSGFVRTGRYEEVLALCDAFAAAHPQAVRCDTFGTTPEGRPMKVLVASTSGALTPDAARERGLPVILMQGGIHAGEIDGKDAGFLALRELLDGRAAKGALDEAGAACSCPCSTSTATSASRPGTGPTSAARRRWAGAPPRRTSTSTATT